MVEEPPREGGAIKYVCMNVSHCAICFVTLKKLGNFILILPIFAD